MGTKSLHFQVLGVIYISCLCNILVIRNTNQLSGEFSSHLTPSLYFMMVRISNSACCLASWYLSVLCLYFKCQAKILDHDNVNYLKKILGELAMVLDQVEAELEKRKLEYQGTSRHILPSIIAAQKYFLQCFFLHFLFLNEIFIPLQVKSVSCGYVDLNLH